MLAKLQNYWQSSRYEREHVRKYVRELECKTLILTEPTKYENADGQVRNGNLIFTILPIYGAVKYHNEYQLGK